MKKDVTLVYPHQLFEEHPAFKKNRHVILVEDHLFFKGREEPLRFHKHKLVFHRSSMKTYAEKLRKKGYTVQYLEYDSSKTTEDLLGDIAKNGYEEFHYADAADHLLSKSIISAAKKLKVSLREYDTPVFLTPASFLEEYFSGRKRYHMADFYRAQRKRMGILLDRGKPLGGKWSFDAENRRSIPEGTHLPEIPKIRHSKAVKEACAYAEKRFPDNPGNTYSFWYPVSHEDAKKWLEDFLQRRLALFGDFEDAMVSDRTVLFHSVLTPVLNTGLLTPGYVIEKTIDFSETHRIPLNSLEGFVRQVIGWREFIRAMYEVVGEKQRKADFWNHDRPMPASFYNGTTGIGPVDTVIRRVADRSYCHHIERLMLLGNFMLLCGIRPADVYRWFMELFIDAYDWVMVPNVYGMSQFADGGIFASKPYISGAGYVLKMSDFKKGPWCDIWNALYWRFIKSHRGFFSKQPRLAIMVRQLERMDSSKIRGYEREAEKFLDGLY